MFHLQLFIISVPQLHHLFLTFNVVELSDLSTLCETVSEAVLVPGHISSNFPYMQSSSLYTRSTKSLNSWVFNSRRAWNRQQDLQLPDPLQELGRRTIQLPLRRTTCTNDLHLLYWWSSTSCPTPRALCQQILHWLFLYYVRLHGGVAF